MSDRRQTVLVILGHVMSLMVYACTVVAQDTPAGHQGSKPEPPQSAPVLVQITGDAPHPQAISPDEFAKLPRRSLRARAHDGVEHQYDGVALVDVLAKAGVPTGKDVRGQALTFYVVVEASDGYRALFSLAELDGSLTDRITLLADQRDGKPLPAKDGPLLVVVPGEKKHARWVKQAIRLKVGRG
jgi:DMSO/TMAO reductase YedYZ molybdopterin-dependent catalytic subunit